MTTPSSVRPTMLPSWLREAVHGRPKEALKRGICSVVDQWDRIRYRDPLLPPAWLRVRVGCFLSFLQASQYQAIGDEFMHVLGRMAELRPSSRVLDIGCGSGQIAVRLLPLLAEGSYDGFDPDAELIDWCHSAIHSRAPNFRFRHADVANSLYNPSGAVTADSFRFPYADGSFDLILLKSVFTHMQPPGLARYLEEIARMLAPSGVCLATFFLLNPHAREAIATGKSAFRFPHEGAGCRLENESVPEYLVAYEEAEVERLASAAGLRVRQGTSHGAWAARPGALSFQDVVALEHHA